MPKITVVVELANEEELDSLINKIIGKMTTQRMEEIIKEDIPPVSPSWKWGLQEIEGRMVHIHEPLEPRDFTALHNSNYRGGSVIKVEDGGQEVLHIFPNISRFCRDNESRGISKNRLRGIVTGNEESIGIWKKATNNLVNPYESYRK